MNIRRLLGVYFFINSFTVFLRLLPVSFSLSGIPCIIRLLKLSFSCTLRTVSCCRSSCIFRELINFSNASILGSDASICCFGMAAASFNVSTFAFSFS
ncbi:unnamed protein product [Orchesella dallaii]|uniref:Secreted protein n=1 Tax=Orchesella dallaii TaxID=48710 RepID=A0ABP1QTP2_9HEXA